MNAYQKTLALDTPNGKCWGCGEALPLTLKGKISKNQKYCRDKCREDYYFHNDWGYFRMQIFKRRGGRCEKCGALESNSLCVKGLHVHHILPISKGGVVCDEDNVLLLCSTCHGKEHAKLNRVVGEKG